MSHGTTKDSASKIFFSMIGLAVFGFFIFGFFQGFYIKNLKNKKEILTDTLDKKIPDQKLLGTATLSYSGGSEERNKNIEIGVARLSGTVVPPMGEFSFAKALGPVTEEEGYQEAKVFLRGDVTKGLGGGLCQVSTILFQSVVDAGLPVTERHNHSYTVVYYDVGLDATFSDPGPDLKFINDTGYPITIKGKTLDQKATFEIYGVPDGRVASTTEPIISKIVDFPPTRYVATTTRDKSEPECINTPQIGYTAELTYNILYPTGERKEQIFSSTYKPLQRICYITASTTSEMNKTANN